VCVYIEFQYTRIYVFSENKTQRGKYKNKCKRNS